ncbi:hypothetical protein P3T37_004868 [Kitasatospora sp. MAA4]|nr:hypothetical protein [Kitasatospora sp. MAA4]MDH6135453.1 hypothetical protein [Kitasatospora sp. MAA4]
MSASVSSIQEEIVARFTELCGNPDDAAVAAAVDRALHDLDALLAAEGS